MHYSRIPYIANSGSWSTGIAITNPQSGINHIVGKIRNGDTGLTKESFTLEIGSYQIESFMVSINGRGHVELESTNPIEITTFIGHGTKLADYTKSTYVSHPGECVPQTSTSRIKWTLGEPYCDFSNLNKLIWLPRNYKVLYEEIFKMWWHKYGITTKILALNTSKSSEDSGHPAGTHTYNDMDLLYYDDLRAFWKLLMKIHDVSPGGNIQIHEDKWLDIKEHATAYELSKYARFYNVDTGEDIYDHGYHIHIGGGGTIKWEMLYK